MYYWCVLTPTPGFVGHNGDDSIPKVGLEDTCDILKGDICDYNYILKFHGELLWVSVVVKRE
jgi:hypothetical protein